jgi:hypothetical protein
MLIIHCNGPLMAVGRLLAAFSGSWVIPSEGSACQAEGQPHGGPCLSGAQHHPDLPRRIVTFAVHKRLSAKLPCDAEFTACCVSCAMLTLSYTPMLTLVLRIPYSKFAVDTQSQHQMRAFAHLAAGQAH